MVDITSLEDLEALYGEAPINVYKKETDHLTGTYRQWIERAPFFAIASVGQKGLDCSPRGDTAGSVLKVLNDRQIAIPDRRGNNRLDTLKNIIRDPRVGLLFLMPGVHETMRVIGRARITTDPDLINQFDMNGKKPATVILVDIDAVHFQCARAVKRANLWDTSTFANKSDVPTAGQMIADAVDGFDGQSYDEALDERQKQTLY
ncbi:MAG: pyridoxamine 5'-phosphate oxidase family protein [Alphaproteobacteria bacterium]|nr:pyridoxamine 5'-phosphate oxidase family protein [Alphaproteobacteria bacterium]